MDKMESEIDIARRNLARLREETRAAEKHLQELVKREQEEERERQLRRQFVEQVDQKRLVADITVKTMDAVIQDLLRHIHEKKKLLGDLENQLRKAMSESRRTELRREMSAVRIAIENDTSTYHDYVSQLRKYKREQGIAACMICAKPHDRPGHSFCSVKCQGDFFNNKK